MLRLFLFFYSHVNAYKLFFLPPSPASLSSFLPILLPVLLQNIQPQLLQPIHLYSHFFFQTNTDPTAIFSKNYYFNKCLFAFSSYQYGLPKIIQRFNKKSLTRSKVPKTHLPLLRLSELHVHSLTPLHF